jgi:hypothetical protein
MLIVTEFGQLNKLTLTQLPKYFFSTQRDVHPAHFTATNSTKQMFTGLDCSSGTVLRQVQSFRNLKLCTCLI